MDNLIDKKKVKVLIPMYKDTFTDLERISLNQIYKILGHYPIGVIKPKHLETKKISDEYPLLTFDSFEDTYFKDVVGYNNLMLSSEFYERFLDFEYILICQLDTYIFRDELSYFCDKGYDYIGAPWLKKKLYQNFIFSYFLDRKKAKYNKIDKPCRQNLYDKVGNGGLSLRRVESLYTATSIHGERIKFYLSHPKTPLYNEDVFWAIEVPEFRYPSAQEALSFAFDKYPSYCYKLNGNQLPFGCHGWYKRKWKAFWKDIIKF